MKAHGDTRAVYAALVGNSFIALMKFFVATVSGSAAMLAEAFHSSADTGNQIMLLVGRARSRKPPDEHHPFGYGMELYFWAFIVSISIFFLGAAFSIYKGIHKLYNPEQVTKLHLALIVLGLSALFEAYPWWVAFTVARKLKRGKGLPGFVEMAVRSKNPTVMVVLLEDSAALLGLGLAATGVTLAYVTQNPVFDAVASVAIGLVLLTVAVFLARETKGLLIGESANLEDRERIQGIISATPEISRCGKPLTMHLGPSDILLALDVEFVDRLTTDEVEGVIADMESRIKAAVPAVSRIYVEAHALRRKPAVRADEG